MRERGAGPGWRAHALTLAVAGCVAAFVLWARWAELDEVSRAEGRVVPSRHVQVVQNLEGGILAELPVREGQLVEPGQLLARLENTSAVADFREGRARIRSLQGGIARLEAESQGRAPAFAPALGREAPDVVTGETALFRSRASQRESELEVLRRQIEQKDQEASELAAKARKLEAALGLAREELAVHERAEGQGAASRVDVLRLRRQVTELGGELEEARLAGGRARTAGREYRERLEERGRRFRSDAHLELTQRQAQLAAALANAGGTGARVTRTDVRARLRGTVKRLLTTTVGAVIKPGDTMMEIVPADDTLLVEASVRPADVAFVRPGQPALVKLTAYEYAIYGGLPGVVEHVSADTIPDAQGRAGYRVNVRTIQAHLAHGGQRLPILPGMTATVDVVTGRKTVLQYLMTPILRVEERALRER